MVGEVSIEINGAITMADPFPSASLTVWNSGGGDVYPEPYWETWPTPETASDRLSKYVGECLDFTSLAMNVGHTIPPRQEIDRVFELKGEGGVTFHHSSRKVSDEDVAVYLEYVDL